jgi:hypothetical protein
MECVLFVVLLGTTEEPGSVRRTHNKLKPLQLMSVGSRQFILQAFFP